MPGLSRRREFDLRAGRFESEVRGEELESPDFAGKRKYSCSKCHRMFEERSIVCPRCDSKTMGELKPIDPDVARRADEKFIRDRRR